MHNLLSKIRKISLSIRAKIETLKEKIYRFDCIKFKKLYARNIKNKIKSKQQIGKNLATHTTKNKYPKSEY